MVADNVGCSAADTLSVTAVQHPASFLPANDSICSYGKRVLQPVKNFSQYAWSTGATSKQLEVITPGLYWLEVVDANGCKGRDTMLVALKQCIDGLFVPTAFTPNSDQKNDELRAMLFGNVVSFEFFIYNRFGQVVFLTKNPLDGWDGKLGGLEQATGGFVWMCRYQLEGRAPMLKKGVVTLIR